MTTRTGTPTTAADGFDDADALAACSAKTRRLALAHYAERLLEEGVVASYADLARRLGITRARMTQILDMALLPVSEQEALLGIDAQS